MGLTAFASFFPELSQGKHCAKRTEVEKQL